MPKLTAGHRRALEILAGHSRGTIDDVLQLLGLAEGPFDEVRPSADDRAGQDGASQEAGSEDDQDKGRGTSGTRAATKHGKARI
jgi:hypothetical protein